ncbi:MAG: J domain-containing protein [Hyphomicrobiaceae bacterium]
MFSKENDYQRHNRTPVSVSITLANGQTLRGTLFVPKTKSLMEELNRGEPFLEFESYDGTRMFIARTNIGSVKEFNIPRVDQLEKKVGMLDQFDAHAVLGIKQDADKTAIRQAYLGLAKTYHPDRFARLELPKEVFEYLSAVATRVNLAYSELRGHGASGEETNHAATDGAEL